MALKEVGVKLVVGGVESFKTQMNTVNSSISNIKGGVAKYQKQIGVGMAAMGASILASGALSVKQFAAMGDEIAKMAKRTGFSTESLSELSFAAERSGTSLSGVEKASRTLSGAIVDANDGLETYQRAFDRIGVSYKDLKGMKPEKQFLTVLQALGKVEDETIQAATASDLFGARMGTQLLPMIYDGTEAFDELRQEAHDLGVVFDEEAAAKAEKMTDDMTNLEKSVLGVAMQIAGPLVDALSPLIEMVTGVIKTITAWLDKNETLKTIIVAITVALGLILVPLGALLILLPGLTAATAAFGISLSAAIWPVTLTVAAIAGLIAVGVLLWKNWDTIAAALKKTWEGLKTAAQTIFKGLATYFLTPVIGILTVIKEAANLASHLPLVGGKFASIANFAGAALDKVKGMTYFQYGGISSGGQAIVGERGQELVSLPPGAMVQPIQNNTFNVTENYARPEEPQSMDYTMQALAMFART